MLKGAVVVLIGILAIVTWRLYREIAANRQKVAQIQELTRSLELQSARETFELQEKCTAQAKTKFQAIPDAYGAHRGHYNAKLNKCFMALELIGEGAEGRVFTKTLFDPYDGTEYARFSEEYPNSIEGHKSPYTCELIQPERKQCESDEEYESYIATFMEARTLH